MAKLRQHRPPSRLRYEKAHPVVSIRIDEELYQRLKDLKRASDKSVADVLREALKVQEPKVKAAFQKGREAGWLEATKRYRVVYRCSLCRGAIVVQTDQEKQAAAKFMHKAGWHHGECPKERS